MGVVVAKKISSTFMFVNGYISSISFLLSRSTCHPGVMVNLQLHPKLRASNTGIEITSLAIDHYFSIVASHASRLSPVGIPVQSRV